MLRPIKLYNFREHCIDQLFPIQPLVLVNTIIKNCLCINSLFYPVITNLLVIEIAGYYLLK